MPRVSFECFKKCINDLQKISFEDNFEEVDRLENAIEELNKRLRTSKDPCDIDVIVAQKENLLFRKSTLQKTIAYEKYLSNFLLNNNACNYLLDGYLLQQEEIYIANKIKRLHDQKAELAKKENESKQWDKNYSSIIQRVRLRFNDEYKRIKEDIIEWSLKIKKQELKISQLTALLENAKRERKKAFRATDFSEFRDVTSTDLLVNAKNIKDKTVYCVLNSEVSFYFTKLKESHLGNYQVLENELNKIRSCVAFSYYDDESLSNCFMRLCEIEETLISLKNNPNQILLEYSKENPDLDTLQNRKRLINLILFKLSEVVRKKIEIIHEMAKRLQTISVNKDLKAGSYLIRFDQMLIQEGCHDSFYTTQKFENHNEKTQNDSLFIRGNANNQIIEKFRDAIQSFTSVGLSSCEKEKVADIKEKVESLTLFVRPTRLSEINSLSPLENEIDKNYGIWLGINLLENAFRETPFQLYAVQLLLEVEDTFHAVLLKNNVDEEGEYQSYVHAKLSQYRNEYEELKEKKITEMIDKNNAKTNDLIIVPLLSVDTSLLNRVEELKSFSKDVVDDELFLEKLSHKPIDLRAEIINKTLNYLNNAPLVREKIEFIKYIVLNFEVNEKNRNIILTILDLIISINSLEFEKIKEDDLNDLGNFLDHYAVRAKEGLIEKAKLAFMNGNYLAMPFLQHYCPEWLITWFETFSRKNITDVYRYFEVLINKTDDENYIRINNLNISINFTLIESSLAIITTGAQKYHILPEKYFELKKLITTKTQEYIDTTLVSHL